MIMRLTIVCRLKHTLYILLTVMLLSGSLASCKSSSHTATRPYAPGTTTSDKDKPTKPKADNSVQKALINEAYDWLGTPYKWGGNDKAGVDCSGFVMMVFHNAVGIDLPRVSREQDKYCITLDRSQLEIGDLLFFSSARSGGKVAHVGMYVGNNMMIHSSSSRGVIVSDLGLNYYQKYYHSAGRVPAIAKKMPIKTAKKQSESQNNNTNSDKTQTQAITAPRPTQSTKTRVSIDKPNNMVQSNAKISTTKTSVSSETPDEENNTTQNIDPESRVANAFSNSDK